MADHKFTLKQLQPDATPNYQPHIKLSFYFKKRPDISDEQFHTHWQTVLPPTFYPGSCTTDLSSLQIHADLAASSAVFKKYVKRYVQFHALPRWKEKARNFEGFEILDFDGCSEIWVDSFEDAEAFFSSEEYGDAMRGEFLLSFDVVLVGNG